MASPQVAEEGGLTFRSDAPEWLSCDLVACHVFEDVSAQIVATCRAFGAQLQGVCGQAKERLPDKGASDDKLGFDCTDDCLTFLTAFGLLSNALLAVGEDLESSVTRPLQNTIATLQEESSGRLKHWHQVRSRFTELQERYGRSRQRSLEARGKLASDSKKKKVDGKKALEQHAAICDLAKCEEDLLESEASLRRLEDESRQRLQQLEQENHVLLRGALVKGTSSLRRLMPVADKVRAPEESDEKSRAQQPFSSVMPNTAHKPEATAAPTVQPAGSASAEDLAAAFADASCDEDTAGKGRQSEEDSSKNDPSAKYLQGSKVGGGLEFSEIEEVTEVQEDSEPEDVAARAANWTPLMKLGATPAAPRKRTLVFQSANTHLIGKSSIAGKDGAPGRRDPPPACSPTASSPLAAVAESSAMTKSSRAAAGAMPFTLSRMSSFHLDSGVSSTATAEALEGSPAALGKSFSTSQLFEAGGLTSSTCANEEGGGSCSSTATVETSPQDRLKAAGVCLGRPEPVATKPGKETSLVNPFNASPVGENKWREVQLADAPQISRIESKISRCSDKIDDSDDEELSQTRPKVIPLEKSEVAMEFSPVIAEDPQKCFERYVQRLPERFSGTTECAWDKLQSRAAEHLLGAHVGKLEFFWICLPGTQGSAETAMGLVCFQFVQGAASNFARVLHLSVAETAEYTWQDVLPSAVLEVRHLLFGTLPVDNVRAIMIANEDDNGRILIDRDVEVAYQRCWFKWFQLTQNLRRTQRSTLGLQRRGKKLASRFLVLHTHRDESDPKAPPSNIGRMAALRLRDDSSQAAPATTDAPSQKSAAEVFTDF